MEFEFGHVDRVKVIDGSDSSQTKIMDLLKKGMTQRYKNGLSKIKMYIQGEKYDIIKHVRFMRVKIWHFDAIKARYFIAVNPIFVTMAAFNTNLFSLLILDAVVVTLLCILLGLSTHDDKSTEGEGLIEAALEVEV